MRGGYRITNPDGIYFLTFATVEWVDVFTRPQYCQVVVDSLNFCNKEKGLIIYGWCLMTNHIHLMVSSNGEDLSGILRDFKKFTAQRLLNMIEENSVHESRRNWMLWLFKAAGNKNSRNTKYQFWRQDNQPKELFSNKFIDQKLDYIHNNPVVAGYVDETCHYRYSSAADYSGKKGLVDVEFVG